MKCKCLILLLFISSFIISCINEKRINISDKELLEVSNLSNVIDSYYLENGNLPASQEEIEKFYDIDIDNLFENKVQKDKTIKYIPVYRFDSKYPDEYSIVSTDKEINKVLKKDVESFYSSLVTVCEYNKGQDGNIILYYSTPFLITSKQALFEFESALTPHWRERIYFNIGFTIDSTINFKDNLDFTYNKDSVIINGTFYNYKVKEKVFSSLREEKNVNLQGFKVENINKNEVVLKDVVFRIFNDTLSGKYKNEVGNLQNYNHIRNCE